MLADHIVTLVVALTVAWAIFRWGALICMGYALWYFCTEQWFYAGFCFALACIIEATKAPVMFYARREGYSGPWV